MDLHVITSIGRPVDFRYPTNRAIALITLVVTLGGLLIPRLSGEPWRASALWGLEAGLSVFLAWALCRELDPDHPMAAFFAAGLAFVALVLWGLPRLAVIFWLLILVRVVNRTTGLPAGVLDGLGLVGLAAWLSLQGNGGYGVVTTAAFFLDSQLPDPARRQLAFALMASIVTAAIAVFNGSLVAQGAPSLSGGLVALALSLLFLPVILDARSLESVGDETGERLTPARIRAAQVLALVTGVEFALFNGLAALAVLSPLWAASLGASLTWLYNSLIRSPA